MTLMKRSALTETFSIKTTDPQNKFEVSDFTITYNIAKGHRFVFHIDWPTDAQPLPDKVKATFTVLGTSGGNTDTQEFEVKKYCKRGVMPEKDDYICFIPKPAADADQNSPDFNYYYNTMNVDNFKVEITTTDGQLIYKSEVYQDTWCANMSSYGSFCY